MTQTIQRAIRQCLLFFLLAHPAIFPTLSSAAEPTTPSSKKEYSFGVFPFLAQPTLEGIFAPLAAELATALDCTIHYQSAPSFEKFMTNLEQGQYDIAHIHPFDYVAIAVKAGYLPLATRTEMLSAVFVVKEESPLHKAQDLKGKKIGLPPKVSAVSYLAKVALLQADIDPQQDVTVHQFNTHQSCLQQVLIGDVDTCATGRPVVRLFEAQTKRSLRVILATPEIPPTLFVAHQRIPAVHREAITKTLIASRLSGVEPGLRTLFMPSPDDNGAYFRRVTDKDYDIVRQYLKMVTD